MTAITKPGGQLYAPLFVSLLLALLLLSVSLTASAGVELSTGSKAFAEQVAELTELESTNDFGQTIINWIAYGHPGGKDALPADQGSLLGHIAFTLSAISLVVMAALAALGGLNYTIHTANKGMPGGQIISSFWMPIRISVATILLVPIAGGVGYSTIHLGVIKIAELGSAHGGYLAGQALDYIGTKGIYAPPRPGGGKNVVSALVQAELCMQYINSEEKLSGNKAIYSKQTGRTIEYNKPPNGFFFVGWMEKKGYCGSVGFAGDTKVVGAESSPPLLAVNNPMGSTKEALVDPPKFDDNEIAAHLASEVYTKIRPKAAAIAASILSDQADLQALKAHGGSPEQFELSQKQILATLDNAGNRLALLAKEYDDMAYESAVADARAITGDEKTWVHEIKEAGWPAFGLIFWQASQLQQKINERMKAYAPVTQKGVPGAYEKDERFHQISARFIDTRYAADKHGGDYDFDLQALADSGSMNEFEQFQQKLGRWMAKLFILADSTDANPITRLQTTGHIMLTASETIILGMIPAKAAVIGSVKGLEIATDKATDAGGKIPLLGPFVKSLGGVGSAFAVGTAHAFQSAFLDIREFLLTLLVPMVLAGFALAMVLPLIPAMFWLLGVVSYMLFFVQCLLVSTFWLAAHGTAEGQGWGSEHTRQGYLLMLGLYLGPILRVAGFAAVLVLVMPVGVLMQWVFNYLLGVASSGYAMTPLMWLGSLVMIVIFAYSAFVRIFALPSEIFEHGLRWINGGQEVTGDSGAEHHGRMVVAAFSHQASAAANIRHSGGMGNEPTRGAGPEGGGNTEPTKGAGGQATVGNSTAHRPNPGRATRGPGGGRKR